MHDGESHTDFVKRIGVARRYLEGLPPTARVVVVSHAVFINFFLEHMHNPRKMGLFRAAVRFIKILLLPNTSITHLRFRRITDSTQSGWELVKR
jgi:broad specificity phosphatase PhoE